MPNDKDDNKVEYFTSDDETYKVFVYGTLKSGGEIRGLHQFGDGASIVGKAETVYPDYEMVDLGAFPGVFENGEHYIQGEVWEVDSETLSLLDGIEGYTGDPATNFYSRTIVHTSEGKAFMYVLDRNQYKSIADTGSDRITTVDQTQSWT